MLEDSQEELQLAKLLTETDVGSCYNVVAREAKIMNQSSPDFKDLIEEYQTSKLICGYVVSGVAPYVAKNFKAKMTPREINTILESLSKDPKLVSSLIKGSMSIIQEQRKEYIQQNEAAFRAKEDKDKYLKDLVANYEISDTLQITSSDLDNIFFLRHCAWDFPDLAAKTMHEEAKRLEEEKPFKGQLLFVEVFWPKRKLMPIEDFIKENRNTKVFSEGKPMVFATDLMGHYVMFVALKICETEQNELESIILLDSTKTPYLFSTKGSNTAMQVVRMAFPEFYESGSDSP